MQDSNSNYYLFLLAIPIIAFLYASVGHGGASGYLALLALFNIQQHSMKSSVLLLNCLVSSVAFYHYYKAGYFKWNLFLPFAIGSVPASFIGSYIVIDSTLYKKILGLCLIFPILKLAGILKNEVDESLKPTTSIAILIGIAIGFVSGMIGIGGGILLSPIILLLHWANMKQTAAVSALFIFVNSAAGLGGFLTNGGLIDTSTYLWITLAFFGGILGAYYGSRKFNSTLLKYTLALVLSLASVKLLLI